MQNRLFLHQLAVERLFAASPAATWFEECSEVVVFGSMAAGLERSDSDIDVLCFGNESVSLKTHYIDLLVIPSSARQDPNWLGSELASHIVEYGIWTKGACTWGGSVSVGPRAIGSKRRRIAAFLRALSMIWVKLDTDFQAKYCTKLRRETQRLILMERGVPVPPTRVLDGDWRRIADSPNELQERLKAFAPPSQIQFVDTILAGSNPHFIVGI